jgi:hypothetical protein
LPHSHISSTVIQNSRLHRVEDGLYGCLIQNPCLSMSSFSSFNTTHSFNTRVLPNNLYKKQRVLSY